MIKLSRSRWFQALVALAVIAVVAPAAGYAVTDEEIFRDFRFNLSNPGARSLGLGGAFIAVSDDATAALSNPAGLMNLQRPEFFTEIRDTQVDNSTIEQTLSMGSATIRSETLPNAVFSPSFISYVYPTKRWAVGVSRLELNKADNNTRSGFNIQFDPNLPNAVIGGTGSIRTDLSVWNVTGALKIRDNLSFGATVAFGFLSLESHMTNNITDPSDPNNPEPRTLFDTAIDDTDTDIAFNAGLQWKPLETLSFGAVYRGGLNFTVGETISNDQFFGGAVSQFFGSPLDTTFNTPDSYGAGVAWQPMSALTLSGDWVHIKYTDLLDGFQSGLGILSLGDPNANFTINDADEFHVGAEYVFTAGSVPIAARVGGYTDHNSRIYADFKNGGFTTFANNSSFPERSSTTHLTVGTGAVVQGKFQIDAAADFSSIVNTYVVSTIFRF